MPNSSGLCSAFLNDFFSFAIFQSDSDIVSSIFCALESIHAALAVMAYNQMQKQLYKEEVNAFFFWLSFALVGLEFTTSPSTLLLQGEEVLFELEFIG